MMIFELVLPPPSSHPTLNHSPLLYLPSLLSHVFFFFSLKRGNERIPFGSSRVPAALDLVSQLSSTCSFRFARRGQNESHDLLYLLSTYVLPLKVDEVFLEMRFSTFVTFFLAFPFPPPMRFPHYISLTFLFFFFSSLPSRFFFFFSFFLLFAPYLFFN